MSKLFEMLQIAPGVTSFIGSGGKTTMLAYLAEELADKRVILTTTTHIFPFDCYPTVCIEPDTSRMKMQNALEEAFGRSRILTAGSAASNGKLKRPACQISFLASLCDYVLIEADGSHGLPLKAHADYEPVIAPASGRTVCILGASGFHNPVMKVCHRPQIYTAIAANASKMAVTPESIVTPEIAAAVINEEQLADTVFINQIDTDDEAADARRFAHACRFPVIYGSLRRHIFCAVS